MRMNEQSEKIDLKLNIQKTKILASDPTTSWQIEGGKVEAETDFIFLSSKIAAGGDFSYGIKKDSLLIERKAMTNLDNILKSRHVTLLTKIGRVKAIVLPVVMYRCESGAMKKAECQRIDAFKNCGTGEDS